MHGGISRAPGWPLPISTLLLPKPGPATTTVCCPASPDCRAWPVTAACRRAKWHPLCARVRQLSAAATMQRLHRSSNLRYPIWPGLAAVTHNARFSRTR
jgi:hypothetical protein